jgi:hypothetical protein
MIVEELHLRAGVACYRRSLLSCGHDLKWLRRSKIAGWVAKFQRCDPSTTGAGGQSV